MGTMTPGSGVIRNFSQILGDVYLEMWYFISCRWLAVSCLPRSALVSFSHCLQHFILLVPYSFAINPLLTHEPPVMDRVSVSVFVMFTCSVDLDQGPENGPWIWTRWEWNYKLKPFRPTRHRRYYDVFGQYFSP